MNVLSDVHTCKYHCSAAVTITHSPLNILIYLVLPFNFQYFVICKYCMCTLTIYSKLSTLLLQWWKCPRRGTTEADLICDLGALLSNGSYIKQST